MNNIKQAAKVEPNPLLKISAFSIIDIHGSKLHMDKLITQHYHNKIIRPKDGR